MLTDIKLGMWNPHIFRAILALLAIPILSIHASPVESKPRNSYLEKKDSCALTTYTVITPCPGAAPTPVTQQFQPVYSCVPSYVVCNAASPTPTSCETIYSRTYYDWVSTAVPCYTGLCTVTDVSQVVTVAAQPSYSIATATCQGSGQCTYGDTTTQVSAPTSFPYVEVFTNYFVAPYSRYNNFYAGPSGGIGSIGLEVYSCFNDVCSIYPLTMVYAINIVTYYVTYPLTINTFVASNTVFIVGGGITININNAPTTISTVIQGTSTLVSTETVTTTNIVTK
jgi:hypothetical protein